MEKRRNATKGHIIRQLNHRSQTKMKIIEWPWIRFTYNIKIKSPPYNDMFPNQPYLRVVEKKKAYTRTKIIRKLGNKLIIIRVYRHYFCRIYLLSTSTTIRFRHSLKLRTSRRNIEISSFISNTKIFQSVKFVGSSEEQFE